MWEQQQQIHIEKQRTINEMPSRKVVSKLPKPNPNTNNDSGIDSKIDNEYLQEEEEIFDEPAE
eukprot:Pgem_evm1s15451